MEEKIYVTTPIYYVNDVPHVGHAYTTIAADVMARYWRKKLGNHQVFLQVGTDEHGQKIAEAAEKAGREPKAFVDALAPRFEDLWKKLDISYDAFIRTTDTTHEAFAKDFFEKLYEQGDIYKGEYNGYYCVGCEEFKTETELVDPPAGEAGGHCVLHPNLTIEHKQEENYFFKLTKYAGAVKRLIESDELVVWPNERKNEVLARLSGEVHDLSISRKSVSWGIPVPWDTDHTFYVWVEALLNYRSVLEPIGEVLRLSDSPADESGSAQDQNDENRRFWPPTHQFMAKDIFWFHAAIWPALLLAAGMDLPKRIIVHGFFTVDGQKMSKTLGNVIDPIAMIERYGVDATRYLLMSAVTFGSDGDLSTASFDELYTGYLSNGLGNLLQRTVTLLEKAGLRIEPGAQPSCSEADQAIESLNLEHALRAVFVIVDDANKRLELAKPWEKIRNLESGIENPELTQTLKTAYRQLETIAAGLEPFMPNTSQEIMRQLRSLEASPLFPRLNSSES